MYNIYLFDDEKVSEAEFNENGRKKAELKYKTSFTGRKALSIKYKGKRKMDLYSVEFKA